MVSVVFGRPGRWGGNNVARDWGNQPECIKYAVGGQTAAPYLGDAGTSPPSSVARYRCIAAEQRGLIVEVGSEERGARILRLPVFFSGPPP